MWSLVWGQRAQQSLPGAKDKPADVMLLDRAFLSELPKYDGHLGSDWLRAFSFTRFRWHDADVVFAYVNCAALKLGRLLCARRGTLLPTQIKRAASLHKLIRDQQTPLFKQSTTGDWRGSCLECPLASG